MEKALSSADANRKFSELLRDVREGGTYVITSHGRPVAKITPYTQRDRVTAAARKVLFDRLRRQRVARIGRWTRDELYEG